MGLAASQARLLTITSRKSDAQFESMRLSHQKLALSRSLADVSNDYQNALNKTKLYYDYYGNGATDNILSYNLFMTPSYINEYTPVLITNQQNRIVLSSNFAAAARAAGIPQEGLDGYIDTTTRNKFISILSGLGEIDAPTAAVIQETEYNPRVGLGYSTGVYVKTETEQYGTFMRQLDRVRLCETSGLQLADLLNPSSDRSSGIMACTLNTSSSTAAQKISDDKVLRLSDTEEFRFQTGQQRSFGTSTQKWTSLSLYDILYGEDDIILTQNVQKGLDVTNALDPTQYDDMINIVKTVIDLLADEIEDEYGLDDSVQLALQYAYANMDAACWSGNDVPKLAVTTEGNADYVTDVDGNISQTANNMLGYSYTGSSSSRVWGGKNRNDQYGDYLNLNYESDDLKVWLPCYSEWTGGDWSWWHDIFHRQMVDREFFRTAEDLSYSDGSGNSVGYEPANYWVSLPSTVAAGMGMKYKNIATGADGIDYYSSDTNQYDLEDIAEQVNGTWTLYEGIEVDELHSNAVDGDGVNKARRNAMVNAIDGAAYNMALFNLYDYTGMYAACDTVNLDNKNIAGNYGSINLSKFVQAWYTYFMESVAMTKINTTEDDDERAVCQNILEGNHGVDVQFHTQIKNSELVTDRDSHGNLRHDLSNLNFDKAQVMVDDGIADIACFYDTIINQICEYGWTENNQVKDDASYLQDMLQSGKMFLFKLANDAYYYQKNYSTDTFIKEIADETAIAEAEAKYKTQKARINAKEEELDIKMKNLDTEISALESEYEAVKKMISNQAQKSFQRYQS